MISVRLSDRIKVVWLSFVEKFLICEKMGCDQC